MDNRTVSASVSAAAAVVPEANWESFFCAEPEDSNSMMQILLDFGSYNPVYSPESLYCSTDGSNSHSGFCYFDEYNSPVIESNARYTPMEQQFLLDETSNGPSESNFSSDQQVPFSTKRRVELSESWELENGNAFKKARAGTNKGKRKTQKSKKVCESEDDRKIIRNDNSSEEESEEDNGSRSKGSKLRAERGSATDPQSLYARKRRERINERLKILQNLVPNGTKVDISTMLEEAVQYVKFLQLQIKLLSSDELWMYAPIACNGMNIGLDLKFSQQL